MIEHACRPTPSTPRWWPTARPRPRHDHSGSAARGARPGKDYPGVRALDGVGLTVTAGQVDCVVGQNGAGKSALITCVTGLVVPTSGAISLGRGSAAGVARLIALDKGFEELVEPEVPGRIELPASTVTQDNVDEFIDLGF
ncbi:MAG TPA: ATP-binding cassette domain-containing protein [Acidimicrobiales bacterium]